MAVIFESIVSTVAGFVFLVILSFVIASDNGLASELSSDPKKGMKDLSVNHPGVFIFMQFVNAFFVAALVEEMMKYFSYRMVVTPDLIPPQGGSSSSLARSSNTGEGGYVYGGSGGARSTGSAITVAVSLPPYFWHECVSLFQISCRNEDGVCGIGLRLLREPPLHLCL